MASHVSPSAPCHLSIAHSNHTKCRFRALQFCSLSKSDYTLICRLEKRQHDAEKHAATNAGLLQAEWRQKLRLLKSDELKRRLETTKELYSLEVDRQRQNVQVRSQHQFTCWSMS